MLSEGVRGYATCKRNIAVYKELDQVVQFVLERCYGAGECGGCAVWEG